MLSVIYRAKVGRAVLSSVELWKVELASVLPSLHSTVSFNKYIEHYHLQHNIIDCMLITRTLLSVKTLTLTLIHNVYYTYTHIAILPLNHMEISDGG